MLNGRATAIFILIAMACITVVVDFLSTASADEDFCYDQAGDGHFCFHQRDTCKHEQRHDEIAETPCYNKDRSS